MSTIGGKKESADTECDPRGFALKFYTEDDNYKGIPYELDGNIVGYFNRNENDDDYFTQPGNLFKLMTKEANTISNIVGAMGGISGPKKDEIINRQLCHWFRANEQLGMGIAKGLGVETDPKLLK